MAPFDNTPLPELAGDAPAGANLEFDPDFAELGRLAQGKPEQQFGSTIVPAEEPDWKAVIAAATALTARTYDLRVLSLLAVARLHREGLTGFADGLRVARSAVEDHWATVHPQLDPEDDNDPLLRANALLTVAEPVRVLRALRTLPLARSARAGSVSWRDISISLGTLDVGEDTPKLSSSVIAGAFADTPPEVVATTRAGLAAALGHVRAIPTVFDERAGLGSGPDFTDLERLLREMLAMVDEHAVAGSGGEAAPVEADAAPAGTAVAAAAPPPVASIATMGPPTNRQDAMRLLDLVLQFYERHEPSSPLPLLISRARRLADKSFIDILRDMAPDGVSQVQMIAGRTEDDN